MKHLYLTILFTGMVMFSSCIYPTIHFADRANSPGFTEKGEFKGVAAIKPQAADTEPKVPGSENFRSSGVAPELDLAYALTDHFAITAGYTSVVNRYTREGQGSRGYYGLTDSTIGGRVNLNGVEVGAGYFLKGTRILKFGLYGSFGIGGISRKGLILPEFNYHTKYWKYSVQPELGIGPNNGRIFSVMFGTRLTGIKYYGFRSANPLTQYAVGYYNPKYGQNVTNQMYFYIEPYANVEVGYKYIKFNAQLGLTNGLDETAGEMGSMPYISLGMLFHFKPSFRGGPAFSFPKPHRPHRR